MAQLPFITPELPGIGGRFKAEPGHFVVEEVPLYEASGAGPHLYVSLTREDWTTRQVAEALARLFGLPVQDIGYAGLKDRHARCTQVFSLPGLRPDDAARIAAALPFRVNWARNHRNKLKIGHLLGNRFRITITDLEVTPQEALARAQKIADVLSRRGLPNYFGPQRFGIQGRNVARGRQALLGQGPRDRWLRKLLISAYQSYLFNLYLKLRLELGLFGRLLVGDIAKKADTGGLFEVREPQREQPRYERGEIHFTGPLYGYKMWTTTGPAGELEARVLEEAGLTKEDFRRGRIAGTRRPGRIWLAGIELALAQDSLQLAFFLPKGAYATAVLREFIKRDEPEGLPVEQEA